MKTLEYKTSRQTGVNQLEIVTNLGRLLITSQFEIGIADRRPDNLKRTIDGFTVRQVQKMYGSDFKFTLLPL